MSRRGGWGSVDDRLRGPERIGKWSLASSSRWLGALAKVSRPGKS